MSGDEDIDVVRYALEQPQPDQVVLNRVNGVVEHGNEDVGEHVACDENSAFFDQQGRMPGACAGCSMIRTLGPSQGSCAVSAGRPLIRPYG